MASRERRVVHQERPLARRCALQALYTAEICGESPSRIIEGDAFLGEEPSDYAVMLVQRCEAHRAGIDKQLTSSSENWSLARMPVVDRCILRMAVCEMLYVDDVPVSVSINEAVELAKAFGGEDESPRFVNGVLGRIARSLEAERGASAEGPEGVAGNPPVVPDGELSASPDAQESCDG